MEDLSNYSPKVLRSQTKSLKNNDKENLPKIDEECVQENTETNDENEKDTNIQQNYEEVVQSVNSYGEDNERTNIEANDNDRQQITGAYGDDREAGSQTQLRDKEWMLLFRENELLKRERDIMQRENDLLKLMASNNVQNTHGDVSLKLVSNFIADYDGSSDGNFWIAQVLDIQKTHNLSDDMLRALVASKLTGRARNWLHLKRNWTSEKIADLLNQFGLVFGTSERKLDIRRKFESRKWQHDENFVDYFNDKLMLSGKLVLEEEELVDYVIDGIPNTHIRTQVEMQRHTNSGELLRTLAGIKLQKPKTATNVKQEESNRKSATTNNSKPGMRCYNCNSVGHFAADCNKPRRLPGTCYACGSTEHMVTNCWQNKKKSSAADENNYNA